MKGKEELHNALKLQQLCLLQALQNNSPGNDLKQVSPEHWAIQELQLMWTEE